MVAPAEPSHGLTSSVFVSCVAYGEPPPTVSWKRNGSLLPSPRVHVEEEFINGVAVIKSSLELCPMLEDTRSGQYSCVVQNGVGGSTIQSSTFFLCFIGRGIKCVLAVLVTLLNHRKFWAPCGPTGSGHSSWWDILLALCGIQQEW
jgi:hypothetical protein